MTPEIFGVLFGSAYRGAGGAELFIPSAGELQKEVMSMQKMGNLCLSSFTGRRLMGRQTWVYQWSQSAHQCEQNKESQSLMGVLVIKGCFSFYFV